MPTVPYKMINTAQYSIHLVKKVRITQLYIIKNMNPPMSKNCRTTPLAFLFADLNKYEVFLVEGLKDHGRSELADSGGFRSFDWRQRLIIHSSQHNCSVHLKQL